MGLLYFAYGSNMSLPRIRRRIDSARRVAVAELAGHQLRFHKLSHDGSGKCDIHATGDNSHTVPGVVYQLSMEDKKILDSYEGVGQGYEVKQVCVTTGGEEELECFAYYATHIDQAILPYHWYKEHVLRGAREQGLPEIYIRQIEDVDSMEDPDRQRHQDEMSHYK